ncbi:cell division protein PerM [Demequina capsici]|uniref:DUF6350 family protein n=1 Tax=Demequina capsici TaxID=3075620 RepID=A0AA96J688_9MICO|nr:DUF6350 family protein [Demequina sp. OYTSA14]WNM23967.1 DUF6350 family protein [Demequina sp. OYTSA14]
MTAPTVAPRAPRTLAGELPVWASGLVTGAVAAAASLLIVVAPTLAALAASPDTGSAIDWGSAFPVATRLWLLGLGVPVATSAGLFSLVPLGLTIVTLLIVIATAQRFLMRSWAAALLASVTFAVLAGFAASFAWAGADDASGSTARAVIGGLVVAAPGAVIGRVRAHGLTIDVVDLIPPAVRTGIRAAFASIAAGLGIAAVAGVVSALQGAHAIADTATALDAGVVGNAVLAVGQLLYLPTLVVWMLAWVSGVGFSVGDGSLYSPGSTTAGALPELPLLGALPQGAGGLLLWTPLLLVAAGVLVRVALRRRLWSWRDDAVAAATATLLTFMLVAVLAALASGAAGPGRLSHVGPEVWAVAGAVAGLLALGYVTVGATAALVARLRGTDPRRRDTEPGLEEPARPASDDERSQEAQPAEGSSTP